MQTIFSKGFFILYGFFFVLLSNCCRHTYAGEVLSPTDLSFSAKCRCFCSIHFYGILQHLLRICCHRYFFKTAISSGVVFYLIIVEATAHFFRQFRHFLSAEPLHAVITIITGKAPVKFSFVCFKGFIIQVLNYFCVMVAASHLHMMQKHFYQSACRADKWVLKTVFSHDCCNNVSSFAPIKRW